MSPTEAREIHDVQRAALADCRTPIPTEIDAASAAFTHLARMLLNGHLTERNLLAAVHTIVVRTGYADSAMNLPLAQIWLLNEEWGQGWGRRETQIKEEIHAACQAQLDAPSPQRPT